MCHCTTYTPGTVSNRCAKSYKNMLTATPVVTDHLCWTEFFEKNPIEPVDSQKSEMRKKGEIGNNIV